MAYKGFRRLFSYLFQRIIELERQHQLLLVLRVGLQRHSHHFLDFILLLVVLLQCCFVAMCWRLPLELFGNPWTFILIWLADYEIGASSIRWGMALICVFYLLRAGEAMGRVMQFMSFSGTVTWTDLALILNRYSRRC